MQPPLREAILFFRLLLLCYDCKKVHMKNKIIFFLIVILIISCQKDISLTGAPISKEVDSTFFIRADDHVFGNRNNAKMYLMMYVDLESPDSRQFYYILKDIVTEYKDSNATIALAVRHFPMDTVRNHHRASIEARAAECIAYQKHDSIFFSAIEDFFSTFLSDDARLESVAVAHGVSVNQFWIHMNDPFFKLKINEHIVQGIKNYFKGAPTTFVVNREGKLLVTIEGKRTAAEIKQIIKQFL